jgi:hypothetical protein
MYSELACKLSQVHHQALEDLCMSAYMKKLIRFVRRFEAFRVEYQNSEKKRQNPRILFHLALFF